MGSPGNTASDGESEFFARRETLRRRVADAARTLTDRGITPTVTRVRAALGGGSPNDLAPALKLWKESFAPARTSSTRIENPAMPVQITDLAHELWQRATIVAAVELKGGPTARALATRTDEAEALHSQVKSLRNQLERESVMYGELRAQAARHEAIARDALARLEESEARERKHLRELGGTRQRVAELQATVTQLRERSVVPRLARPSRSSPKVRASKSTPRRKPAQRTRPPRPGRKAKRPPLGTIKSGPTTRVTSRAKKSRATRAKPRSRR
jgi:hypothetical protein